jgi:hypothetical protein
MPGQRHDQWTREQGLCVKQNDLDIYATTVLVIVACQLADNTNWVL